MKLQALWRHRAALICILYITGILAFLALPLGAKKGYHDEKSLLLGSAATTFRTSALATIMSRVYPALVTPPATKDSSATLPELIARAASLSSMSTEDPQSSRWFNVSYSSSSSGLVKGGSLSSLSCSTVHGVVPAQQGDGTEGIAIVLPITTIPPSTDNDNQQQHQVAALAAAIGVELFNALHHAHWLAKDVAIVFLDNSRCSITQATEAWLSAYNSENMSNTNDDKEVFNFPRAGSLQQAVIIDIQSTLLSAVTLQVHGSNGQLPNYDLFWLLRKNIEYYTTLPASIRPGNVPARRERKGALSFPPKLEEYKQDLATAGLFIWELATGRGIGAHAAFLKRGIDAATVTFIGDMPSSKTKSSSPSTSSSYTSNNALDAAAKLQIEQAANQVLGFSEAVIRTCNNLQEKLHHANALYVLLSPDTFAPIGVYLAAPGCFLLAALVLFVDAVVAAASSSSSSALSVKTTKKSTTTVKRIDNVDNWLAAFKVAGTLHAVAALSVIFFRQLSSSSAVPVFNILSNGELTRSSTSSSMDTTRSMPFVIQEESVSVLLPCIVVVAILGIGITRGISNFFLVFNLSKTYSGKNNTNSTSSTGRTSQHGTEEEEQARKHTKACTAAVWLGIFITESVALLLVQWALGLVLLGIALPMVAVHAAHYH